MRPPWHKRPFLHAAAAAAVLLGYVAAASAQKDELAPVIEHEPCAQFEKGTNFELVVRITDESDLFEPKVIFRAAPRGKWRPMILTRDEKETAIYRATLPSRRFKGAIDYFVEAFDTAGNGPTRVGDSEAPIRVRPSARPEPCIQLEPTVETPPDAGTDDGQSATLSTTAIELEPTEPEPTEPEPTEPEPTEPEPTEPTAAGPTAAGPTAAGPSVAATEPIPAVDDAPENGCDATTPPLYCEWWVWAAGGGIVAATVVTVVLVAVSGSNSVPDTIRVEVSGPNPGSALRGRP